MCERASRLHSTAIAAAFVGIVIIPQSTLAQNIVAAIEAAHGETCEAAQPFYWEIGAASGGPIVSGQVGGTAYARDTVIPVASASKWIFGAYVVERYGGIPGGTAGATIVSSLNMLEGHTQFSPQLCVALLRVQRCHTILNNDTVDGTKVGYFNYNGGDGQYAAADDTLLDLGNKTKSTLLAEVNSYLNLHSSFSYQTPGVAGGLEASAEGWAHFLQKLMDGTYEMSDYLGDSPVDTVCANCASPMGSVNMHYSLYHWVEDQTEGELMGGAELAPGDGAFSSAGAFGFYPWISADQAYYGIISRVAVPSEDSYPHEDSLVCGQAVRAAFLD